MEVVQEKVGFFYKTRNLILLLVGVLILGALVVAFRILTHVDEDALRQDALQAEEDIALYIVNEALLAEGEEIENITFDVVTKKCDTRAVCGEYDQNTEINIKSTQREWVMEIRSFPNATWYYSVKMPHVLCVDGETTDDDLCFSHYRDKVNRSTWTKTLDDIAVRYDNDFPIG